MTRAQLIQRLAANSTNLELPDCRLATLALLTYLSDTLLAGNRLEIREFGTLDTQPMAPVQRRNPRTGVPIWLGHRRRTRFKMAKALREKVNTPRR